MATVTKISVNDYQYIGKPLRIYIKSPTKYTHKLEYSFGEQNGIIVDSFSGSYFDWVLPNEFYDEMPDSIKKNGTITCTTYENGKKVGTASTSFSAVISGDQHPKIIAVFLQDTNKKTVNLTGDSTTLIKGYSDAKITYMYSGSAGASIVKSEYQCGDGQKNNSGEFKSVKSNSFRVKITDSRGLVAEKVVSPMMIDYFPITCNLRAKGADEVTGDIPVNISGVCFSGSFGKTDNTFTISYRIKENNKNWQQGVILGELFSSTDGKYDLSFNLPGYNYKKKYTIVFSVSDYLSDATSNEQVVSTIPVFHWGEYDFVFNVPITAPEINLSDEGVASLKKLLGIE